MNIFGKIIGVLCGFFFGGPVGALFGGFLGHQFDRGLDPALGDTRWHDEDKDNPKLWLPWFNSVFLVMGHVSKADGTVSPNEIKVAEAVMQSLQLNKDQRQTAIYLFQQGKQSNFDLSEVLRTFLKACQFRKDLMGQFVEFQLQSAYANGAIHDTVRHLLYRICEEIRFPSADLQRMEMHYQFHSQYHSQRAWQQGDYQQQSPPVNDQISNARELQLAYQMLDVSDSTPMDQVKRAYRKLMSQHHPDKMQAKGVSSEALRIATRKTQEIKAAYDKIKRLRTDLH